MMYLRTVVVFLFFTLTLFASPCAAQSGARREQRQIELYQQTLKLAADQLSLSPTDPAAVDVAALGEYAMAQLGRPGSPVAEEPSDRFATGLYKLSNRFSQKLAEILTSDTGRWIGTSDEAVLVFLDLHQEIVFYSESQLAARRERLASATEVLRQYDAAALGPFEIESNEAARQITEDALWVLMQEEELNKRLATIATYERRCPEDGDWTGVPTLMEAINDYIGSAAARERLVVESARERERRESLELRRDQAATDERERIEIELRRTRELGQLSQAILEREYDIQVVAQERELAGREAQIARELTDLKEQRRQLELELANRNEQIQSLQDQIDVLSAKAAIREMPAEVRGLVGLLTTPGTWKPESIGHRQLRGDASYGIKPQPHSLSALAAVGALDEGPEGIYALYVVMANSRTDRPKYGGSWTIGYGNGVDPYWTDVDIEAEIRRDAALYERVKRVHDALREWGDELVAQRALMP